MNGMQALKNTPPPDDLDPNVSQRRASDPEASVWVGASAGTGKTKVLTDRVLRLLLPRRDGRPGAAPHRILCLTFTKAAASEMLQRINETLADWATVSDEKLHEKLRQLTGAEPDKRDISAARRLFAAVVDTPGGLKVMTIHSFCQSVLGRFPVEAGLPPHFSVIDEAQARELLQRARDDILAQAKQNPGGPLGMAVRHIAAWQNEEQFAALLGKLCGERRRLAGLDLPALHEKLCAFFAVGAADTEESVRLAACRDGAFDSAALYAACRALAAGSEKNGRTGADIQRWLELSPAARQAGLDDYAALFLKDDGEKRKKLATKDALAANPDCENILLREAQRLATLYDTIKAVQCAKLTDELVLLGSAIIDSYQQLKDARAALDYDDLVLKTLDLLGKDGIAPWVMFKLDGGLDHILVDEAQDTNPEQWQIILRLTEEFFSGSGAREDIKRTSFIVGDEKQSIYSFQRAAPDEYARIRRLFVDSGRAREENLNISFRSAESVLRLVDEVFAPAGMRAGVSQIPVAHHSHRKGQAGLAELWPLFSPDIAEEEAPWTPPGEPVAQRSGAAKLADYIGEQIKLWLDKGEIVESKGRAVQPGDIMILLRTRTAFAAQLVRALKTRGVPVSGVDRMVLGEQLAVMDLLTLARFALLPADDLSLACALKSPFIGLSEDQLYDLAVDRRGSLWQALRESAHKEIAAWLEALIGTASSDPPYEFFSRLLQQPCPADKVSGLRAMQKRLGAEALDPLDEFLNAALSFERSHIPALQSFLLWQKQGDITIKRELEEAGGAVRIMTVHGAKGLQAPIVIMPDTLRTAAAKKIDTLLWPAGASGDMPLWAPRRDLFPSLYVQARARREQALDEEYRRLLYVALTRAEDRLYVAGYQGRNTPSEDSWYYHVRDAFARLPEAAGALRIANPQTRPPDGAAQEAPEPAIKETAIPPWFFRPAGAEPFPPRPLMPSRPEEESAVRSPLEPGDSHRFRRGVITHRLLQVLPGLPAAEREAASRHFVARPAHRLPQEVQRSIVAETMTILENPAYAALFGPAALAEVPLTGLVNGRLVSAQIDRLLVTDKEILIVDYKTNRPPPREEKDVPPVYRRQMVAYRDIVAAIWPGRTVRCFLLWTDGPVLMPLTL